MASTVDVHAAAEQHGVDMQVQACSAVQPLSATSCAVVMFCHVVAAELLPTCARSRLRAHALPHCANRGSCQSVCITCCLLCVTLYCCFHAVQVGGAIETAKPEAPVDVMMGIGGTPEVGSSPWWMRLEHLQLKRGGHGRADKVQQVKHTSLTRPT